MTKAEFAKRHPQCTAEQTAAYLQYLKATAARREYEKYPSWNARYYAAAVINSQRGFNG